MSKTLEELRAAAFKAFEDHTVQMAEDPSYRAVVKDLEAKRDAKQLRRQRSAKN